MDLTAFVGVVLLIWPTVTLALNCAIPFDLVTPEARDEWVVYLLLYFVAFRLRSVEPFRSLLVGNGLQTTQNHRALGGYRGISALPFVRRSSQDQRPSLLFRATLLIYDVSAIVGFVYLSQTALSRLGMPLSILEVGSWKPVLLFVPLILLSAGYAIAVLAFRLLLVHRFRSFPPQESHTRSVWPSHTASAKLPSLDHSRSALAVRELLTTFWQLGTGACVLAFAVTLPKKLPYVAETLEVSESMILLTALGAGVLMLLLHQAILLGSQATQHEFLLSGQCKPFVADSKSAVIATKLDSFRQTQPGERRVAYGFRNGNFFEAAEKRILHTGAPGDVWWAFPMADVSINVTVCVGSESVSTKAKFRFEKDSGLFRLLESRSQLTDVELAKLTAPYVLDALSSIGVATSVSAVQLDSKQLERVRARLTLRLCTQGLRCTELGPFCVAAGVRDRPS